MTDVMQETPEDDDTIFLPTVYLEAYQSLQALQDSWIFSTSRKNRKDLKKLTKNLNLLHSATDCLQDAVKRSEAKQQEFLESMETVRERNRHLEQKLIDSGLTRGKVSEGSHRTSEWEDAVKRYGQRLYVSLRWSSGPEEAMDIIEALNDTLIMDKVTDLVLQGARLAENEWSKMEKEA